MAKAEQPTDRGNAMMKRLMAMSAAAGVVLVMAAVPGAQAPSGQAPKIKTPASSPADKVRITGWALSMSTAAPGANQTIQITINKWSSAPQRERLIQTFLDKKQDGLLRALEDEPELGRFNFPGYMGPDPNNTMRLGTTIRYAWSHPGEDGGRRIVVITPRVIGFREATTHPRTYDYPFTLFEMRFKSDGKGEGKYAVATAINFDKKKKVIELENYSSEPVRLNELKLEVIK
jgi:hypothetical protein